MQCLSTDWSSVRQPAEGAEYSVAVVVGPALGNVCSFSGATSPFNASLRVRGTVPTLHHSSSLNGAYLRTDL